MDQQYSAIVKRRCPMFIMSTSCHNSCSQPKSPPINRLINDRVSANQTLPQLIKISHKMLTDPLLQHCQDSVINKTAVRYVKKPQVWCYDEVWRLATKLLDGCVRSLCWHAVLLKLKPVLRFRIYKEYEICL